MSSEFDDAMEEMLDEALCIFGTVEFQIGSRTFAGDLSELGQESFAIVQGGKEVIVNATLVAPLGQFAGELPPDNTRLRVGARWFRVASRSVDVISIHLQLADADAH